MAYKEYKPEKLYYSIGEVAELLGESTSLVRFWTDSFSNFVRPERNAKGDRKYTPKDIENLRIIHHLVKDKKMTLEGAAARMKGNKEGLDNRAEVVQRLKGIKEMLQDIAKSIDE
ncbi:MAG: MerR family transcriptional regulator [Bacteroidales bacterium]|jgi:DNA-binding transcriptional MerR regulator|nr:MerR family transcriptional regulator [Bacteroidales bacterium]MBO7257012.1 MerR family transcriptional regulator [Bacteroidales bacterium]MBO7283975.1 MerR family transcriptional regulator [Bacteroidales bacterium]MBO7323092.1 MerR family transcriptional regulator [Bacteroidales bacterium]MBQ1280325.1 MerR family transcriptional regulator [Bacteroidales bacterium]